VNVVADRSILGHQLQVVLDGGRVDQPVGGVPRERRGQGSRGVGDRWGYADRADLVG
jgi:hemolysin activation/secretion protein